MFEITSDHNENVKNISSFLSADENFDIIRRNLRSKNNDSATLFYIDGFIKANELQKLFLYFINLDSFGDGKIGAAKRFSEHNLPDVEIDITSDFEKIITHVLCGGCVLLAEGFGNECICIDLRTYPSRETQDSENDRVMRGARDGFVETLIFNTALIRRRIRDAALQMRYCSVGERSRTDIVICYIKGLADDKFVRKISADIQNIKTDALPLGHQSLIESICKKQWYNPFPKVRLTERPDAASAHILEGGIVILCDTSPEAILLPTSIFDFLQETNDFYFPPVTGSYLRISRSVIFISTIFITPLWYLFLKYSELLPEWLKFIVPEESGELPIIVQLLLTEFALDALKLASLTTPSAMSNSLSIIGGLLLGDFAVQSRLLIPEVIFYMAFTSIANFTQSNYELGYAFKYFRVILLILTALFGIYGFVLGIALILILVCSLRGVGGKSYLYPLFPWNGGAMKRLIIREKKK